MSGGPEVKPFEFNLAADDKGVTELKFTKDAQKIFATMLFAIEYINSTFDQPFQSTGDFIRMLAETSDKMDIIQNERKASEAAGAEAGTEEKPEAPGCDCAQPCGHSGPCESCGYKANDHSEPAAS